MPGRRYDNRGSSPYARSLRVNQVLRQVLAEEIERLADADERLRLVTVTSVDTAPDLRSATVYLSSLSDEAAEGLAERRAHLQRTVNRQTRMKRTPLLAFEVDPAVVSGSKVEDVLRRLRTAEPAEPGPGGGSSEPGPGARSSEPGPGAGSAEPGSGAGSAEPQVSGAGPYAGEGVASAPGEAPGAEGGFAGAESEEQTGAGGLGVEGGPEGPIS